MTDLTSLTLAQAREALRKKEFSATELAEVHLAAVEQARALNAFVMETPERTRAMALIPETPDVYEMLTVWEHLVFVAKSCRLAQGWQDEARALLERFAIADQRDSLGEALSKGMRQKLLIAAAVLASTPVLLLDEPMIGLDPRGQRELKAILYELRAQGRALVVSTHLLGYIEGLCDRVLILKQGQAIALDSVDGLLASSHGKSLEDRFLEIVESH